MRKPVSATVNEAELLVQSFRAAALQCVQTTPGRLGTQVHDVSTKRIEVREVSFEAGVILSLPRAFSRFGMAIGLKGDIQTVGTRLSDSNIAHINGQNGMVTRLAPGSRWCNVTLDRHFIQEVAEVHGYELPTGDAARGLSLAAHGALGETLVRTARNQLWSESCDAELEDAVALTVLRVFESRPKSAKRWSGRRQRVVNRVIDYIQAECTSVVTVTGLCHLAGVGERNLQTAFRDITGLSMQQYLTACRLQAARALLLRGEFERVADVARACGIHHPGRFAQYYLRRYGESPSRSMPGARAVG